MACFVKATCPRPRVQGLETGQLQQEEEWLVGRRAWQSLGITVKIVTIAIENSQYRSVGSMDV